MNDVQRKKEIEIAEQKKNANLLYAKNLLLFYLLKCLVLQMQHQSYQKKHRMKLNRKSFKQSKKHKALAKHGFFAHALEQLSELDYTNKKRC